jgi:hypothetical protein
MVGPSIEDFLISAVNNAYRLALEGRAYRDLVSADPVLRPRADAVLSSAEFAARQQRLATLVVSLEKAVRAREVAHVAEMLGAMAGELSSRQTPR